MRRTISCRCRVTATSRTVTMASISRADSELVTWSRRDAVALQCGQRLVGAGQHRLGALQDVAHALHVQRDDLHGLADRNHRQPGLDGHAFGRAVPGARFLGGDAGVRDQLDRGRAGCCRRPCRRRWHRPSWPVRAAGWGRTRCRCRSRRSRSLSTAGRCPSTISAPVRPRRMRSKPSRSCVPGATRARVALSASSGLLTMCAFPSGQAGMEAGRPSGQPQAP